MRITNQATDEALLREIGARVASARLERNWTQAQLADRAGISKRTVERLETGSVAANLSAFLRLCRALGIVERLELLLPEQPPSPIEQLKLRGKRRQRASGSGASRRPKTKKWSWGDGS